MKKLRIGFIATRLSGTDGVSLEVEKWARVLQRLGHAVFFCAGELGGYASGGALVPEMHFVHPEVRSLSARAFEVLDEADSAHLEADIYHFADRLWSPLAGFILLNRLDLVIIQNALAIPMNLPLGVCLARLVAELGIPALAHHHDFYWERARFQANIIPQILDSFFPPDLPGIRHMTINSIAQKRLELRRGIVSTVIPNVHDFAVPPPGIDDYNRDLPPALGQKPGQPFILQPTRVIQRKGIELAIELVRRLELPAPALWITHPAGDEGLAYWHWLQREAQAMGVDLRLVAGRIGTERRQAGGRKIYSLWDAYPHAGLVTYPSLYEGFGNALLEAVYFGRPVVVNRYPVYNADIGPLGFEFIELDGFVSETAVQQARRLLGSPEEVRRMAQANYRLAQEHFSLEALQPKLAALLDDF